MTIQERLRRTYKLYHGYGHGEDANEAADLLDEAERVVEESAVVIEEASNILRERLPSLADNVLMPVAHKSRAFLAKLKEQPNGND